jgi:hypothetical protein
MINRIAALALFAALLAPAVAPAQNTYDDQQQLIAQIQTDKRAVVMDAMKFTDAEAQAFSPVYDGYQAEMKATYQAGADLLNKYAANYDTMTDETAKAILKDWFKIRDQRNDLVEKYAKKLGKDLPPKKVLRWVQIEHKLNTLLDAETAAMIPLTK